MSRNETTELATVNQAQSIDDKIIAMAKERWRNHSPIVVHGTRSEYVDVALSISQCATDCLIWTMGAPALLSQREVEEAGQPFLTREDMFFRGSKCAFKLRLVVFAGKKQLCKYMASDMERRRSSFEGSCKQNDENNLWFTSVDHLERAFPSYEDTQLDVGYVLPGDGKVYCFHSPFVIENDGKAQPSRNPISVFPLEEVRKLLDVGSFSGVPAIAAFSRRQFYSSFAHSIIEHKNHTEWAYRTAEEVQNSAKWRRRFWFLLPWRWTKRRIGPIINRSFIKLLVLGVILVIIWFVKSMIGPMVKDSVNIKP